MYRWLRNTHLFLGLFTFLFIIMYAVSSVQMAHNSWFRLTPAVATKRIAIAPEKGTDARAVARELMDRNLIGGEINEAKPTEAGFSFRVVRPGAVQEIMYSRELGAASIRISKAGLMGMLNRIHHIAGLDYEYLPTKLWAYFVVLVSLSLMVMAVTGIYLWFKLHQERVAGSILLAISLGYSLTLMVLIRMA